MPKSPHKKYTIIYADPPWSYNNKTIRGGAANHYSTMSTKEICALPIERIRADNCAAFIWATQPNIKEALAVMEAWGFRYVNFGFTWIKLNKGWHARLMQTLAAPDSDCEPFWRGIIERLMFLGPGFWTRGNPEICLFGTRGKPQRIAKDVRQLVVSPVSEHSEKPAVVRDRIVRLFGDVPRVELFARQEVAGWDAWGSHTANIPDWTADDE